MNKIIKYIFGLFILSSVAAFAKLEKEVSIAKTLDSCMANSPLIARNKFELEKAGTTLKQVQAMKILPMTTFDFRTGIVPGARGDVFYSPNSKYDLKRWGPFFQTELEFAQPIFTFGRISNAEKGADELINIQSYNNKSNIDELQFNAIQVYWTALAANKAVEIACELKAAYDTLTVKIDEEIKNENSELDQSYEFEVKSNEYLVNSLYSNSFNNRRLAARAYQEIVGPALDSTTNFSDERSPIFDKTDAEIDSAVNLAMSVNPDAHKLESGLKAIESQIEFQNSSKYPLIFVAGGVQFGYASNRDRQNNPFVYDNFNYINLGGFLGLKWDLNFRPVNIEIERWQAEKLAMLENQKLLKSKINIEVSKAFFDAKNAYEQVVDIKNSAESAKSWVEMGYDNWTLGIGDPERFIKASAAYFQLRAKAVEKEYEYNVALAKLAYSMGVINNYIKWIKNEKIEF